MINRFLAKEIAAHLPFVPSPEQERALQGLSDFILSEREEGCFLLKGYAGTGKSSLAGAVVQTLSAVGRKCILLAPTGRAAKVFSAYAGAPAYTIHKKIYRQKSFSAAFEGFSLAPNLHKNTLFLVDEASMISARSGELFFGQNSLLDDLISYVYNGMGCRLILMGDNAQLPPVGEHLSPALDPNVLSGFPFTLSTFELKEVARQQRDSGILYNATHLRKSMQQTPLPPPQLYAEAFEDVIHLSGDQLIETLSTAYDQDTLEETIVITRSNKRANLFNQGIRSQILYREEELCSGDLLLIARNNYHWCKPYEEIDFIANGDIARVLRILKREEMHGFRFADVQLYLPDYDIEIEAKVILDTLSSETPALSPEQNNLLYNRVLEDYAELSTKRARLASVKEDPFFNALQVKYGYAVTCHKAQGGQWKNIFLDMGYLNPEALDIEFYRWLYTAITRATQRVYLLNVAPQFRAEGEKGYS